MMHNMLMSPNAGPASTGAPGGYVSPTAAHQHPESAFFKPKINAPGERGQAQASSSQRATRIGSQRHVQGTLSPKGGAAHAPRGGENLQNAANGSPQHLWTSKKKPPTATPFNDNNQQQQKEDQAQNAQQNQA